MNTTVSTDFFIPPIIPDRTKSVLLQFEFDDAEKELTADEFWGFCVQNDKLQMELIRKNEIKITFPRGWQYSQKSMEIMGQVYEWQKLYRTGEVFNHLVGYLLPSNLILSPSFSWTEETRFADLSKAQKENLIHLCPDFVIELRASSDILNELKTKMTEYIKNGARLSWLIDPKNKRVYVYRAGGEVEVLENPDKVSGEDVLENFELDLTEIW